jgi:phenylalanyl-tRNA synthetase beta chain
MDGEMFVNFGKLKSSLLKHFDLKNDVFYANFYWDVILKKIPENKTLFTELPRYPEVKRDLSMVLEKTINFDQVRDISLKAEKNLLREIVLFDVYEDEKIEKGKKSYAVSYTIRDDKKTLTDKEIAKIMDSIARLLQSELGAQIRS